jgi:hypothetical protein
MLYPIAKGLQSSDFNLRGGDWYDDWGINRNNYAGSNGYLPSLAFETLGENRELAYDIGVWFQDSYQIETDRAEAILRYVQTWTEYGYDSDNVFRNGVPQEEWAWNADEMAHAFDETRGVTAIGDCEDMAFLCGTIYVGAGIDAAIVDATDHAALLIWLPEFANANHYWDLPNDEREAGWIWVEATGGANPLGWTPPDFDDGGWTAHSIGSVEFVAEPQPSEFTSTDFPSIDFEVLIVIVSVIFSIILGYAMTAFWPSQFFLSNQNLITLGNSLWMVSFFYRYTMYLRNKPTCCLTIVQLSQQ